MTVTLKLATSLDGRIATASGESRWITGPEAREAVHQLRAEHDAVLVGIDTALADDPDLSVRLPGYDGPQPARVVLDSRQRLPASAAMLKGGAPVYVIAAGAPNNRLTDAGARVLQTSCGGDGRPDLAAVLEVLKGVGLSRIMVEGGGQVAASFLRAGLVDALEWFRAPMAMGSDGRPAVGSLGFSALDEAPRFRRVEARLLGEDLWERYERR